MFPRGSAVFRGISQDAHHKQDRPGSRRRLQNDQTFTSPISPSTLGSYLWDSSVTGVNLNRVGPQRQYGRTVMRVQGQTSGLCHLRGDSLAVYEENRWKALSERDYAEAGDAVSALTAGAVRIAASEEEEAGFSAVSAAYSMSIETEMKSGVYYTPYYPLTLPEGAAPYHDAYIRNSSQRTSYAVLYTDAHTDVPDETYEAFVHETYTQVPDQTRQALADILQQLDVQPGDDPHRILAAVQSYVSSSARYDLNTPAVPDGEDFVSWFLHESETGYCVHFATAAAILLRCMDVPARYVTGFSTNVTAGSWTTVTTDDAHAWVEYYVDGLGWYVLDPTPAMQDSHILTLQPDNSSETDPAPTQEEDQVQQVPETSTTETTPDAPEVSPETSDKPTGTNQESSKTFHFFRYLWPILAAAAAVAVLLSLLTYFSSTSSVLENIAGVLTSPFRAATTAVSGWVADKRQYYEDVTSLKEENAALKKEVAELRAQQRQAQADSEENKLLRELLKLQEQRRDFQFVSTAVLAHSESSWTSSLTLNHGTDQGIAAGDCVVSAEGYLVGIISEVGYNWSTVLTIIDTDTELGARIFRTGEVAVAEGNFALMGQGRLKLSYLTSDDEVLIGDQIVTSGLGGYYPSGLVIGAVESLKTGDDGLARYAVLAPMMDLNTLTEVFVITDFAIVD